MGGFSSDFHACVNHILRIRRAAIMVNISAIQSSIHSDPWAPATGDALPKVRLSGLLASTRAGSFSALVIDFRASTPLEGIAKPTVYAIVDSAAADGAWRQTRHRG